MIRGNYDENVPLPTSSTFILDISSAVTPSSDSAEMTLLDVLSAVSRLHISVHNSPGVRSPLIARSARRIYVQSRPAPVSVARHELVGILLGILAIVAMAMPLTVSVAVMVRMRVTMNMAVLVAVMPVTVLRGSLGGVVVVGRHGGKDDRDDRMKQNESCQVCQQC